MHTKFKELMSALKMKLLHSHQNTWFCKPTILIFSPLKINITAAPDSTPIPSLIFTHPRMDAQYRD